MGCVRHVCVRPRSSIEWDERLILSWTTAPLPRAAILINVLMGFHFHVASDLIVDPAAVTVLHEWDTISIYFLTCLLRSWRQNRRRGGLIQYVFLIDLLVCFFVGK